MNNNLFSKQRLIGLDLFRIAAALITFWFHSIIHFDCNFGLLQEFLGMGAVMMTGFFMLSGFSLYYVYDGYDLMQMDGMKKFFTKRLVGIVPMYYAVGLIYAIVLGTESLLQSILILPVELLGLQSVFSSLFSVSHNGGTWFISCIILCYLCFPFLLTMLKQMCGKGKTSYC